MNRFWVIIGIVVSQLLYLHAQDGASGLLDKHKLQERILLLFAGPQENALKEEQLKKLNAYPNELMRRNILIYVVSPEDVMAPSGQRLGKEQAMALYQQFFPQQQGFALIFIDLNGIEQWRSLEVVPAQSLFEFIDATALRRAEVLDSLIEALNEY